MSENWALTYCEQMKQAMKTLVKQTQACNGENIVLALGPTQGMCKVILQRRANYTSNDCLSKFRTI